MKFLCPHCANGAMRIVAVDGSAVRIECLRCGRESVLEVAPPTPDSPDRTPAAAPPSGDSASAAGTARPGVAARVSATSPL